jgi:glutaconyl-CoA/methylmalonyl-CoA decarboxylase subunit gamma
MKKYKFTIQGIDYDVDILNFEDNVVEIEVNGTNYSVEVHKDVKKTKTPKLVRASVPQPKRSESKPKKNISSAGTAVKAPLPGSIFKLLVKEGDEVKTGDVLLIMEAMKMENNVLAEKDGRVINVKIAEGDAVLQNDVLLEIQ